MNAFIQTYSGLAFTYPLVNIDAIEIVDIANALSKQCRFAGHCLKFYSVAEHCCHVSDHVSDENKFAALMHDASEAYMVDIPRPLKQMFRSYQVAEEQVMQVIATKFGFDYPLPAEVKRVDTAIVTDERAQNMAIMDVDPLAWGNVLPGIGAKLKFWTPDVAAREFMARFDLWS